MFAFVRRVHNRFVVLDYGLDLFFHLAGVVCAFVVAARELISLHILPAVLSPAIAIVLRHRFMYFIFTLVHRGAGGVRCRGRSRGRRNVFGIRLHLSEIMIEMLDG